MSNWNHFTDEETKGSEPEFVAKVDKGRHLSGIPWPATNWKRTPETNTDPNAVKNSAHLIGRGVDIDCNDNHTMGLMIEGAHAAGLNRVGIYVKKVDGKLIPTHLHFDDDPSKVAHDIWIELER